MITGFEKRNSSSVVEVFGILGKPNILAVDASDEEVQRRISTAITKEKLNDAEDDTKQ